MNKFEIPEEHSEFDDLRREYLHSQNDARKIVITAKMESSAGNLNELETLDRLLTEDGPVKRRVQNRIQQMLDDQNKAA
jgi:hypothetical protein